VYIVVNVAYAVILFGVHLWFWDDYYWVITQIGSCPLVLDKRVSTRRCCGRATSWRTYAVICWRRQRPFDARDAALVVAKQSWRRQQRSYDAPADNMDAAGAGTGCARGAHCRSSIMPVTFAAVARACFLHARYQRHVCILRHLRVIICRTRHDVGTAAALSRSRHNTARHSHRAHNANGIKPWRHRCNHLVLATRAVRANDNIAYRLLPDGAYFAQHDVTAAAPYERERRLLPPPCCLSRLPER